MEKIEIYRGDDVELNITITDDDGNVVDLTDSTLYFTVKSKKTDTDSDAVIQKTVTSFSSPLTGTATINLISSDTDVEVGLYFYDFQLVTDKVISSGVGRFLVKQDITLIS